MDYIVIKLHFNDKNADIHDIYINESNKLFERMRLYAKEHGRSLYFSSVTSGAECGVPVEIIPFAEVEYTGTLTEEEKRQYIDWLKFFSIDGEYVAEGCIEEFPPLKMVRFRKVDDEFIEL